MPKHRVTLSVRIPHFGTSGKHWRRAIHAAFVKARKQGLRPVGATRVIARERRPAYRYRNSMTSYARLGRAQCAAVAYALALVATFTGSASAQPATNLPPCRIGFHAPLVSPLNRGAMILDYDAAKGSYKVKSDGDGLIDWVPAYKLRYSCVGADAKPVTESYFIGDWSLFIGPTPNKEIIDSKGYLVVGPGAHVPPLKINGDGSYIWVIDSRTTIRGRWRTLAANELRSGTKAPAILLINGEHGKNWEVWKTGVNQGNNRDAIGVERMDMGLSAIGTRLQ